MTMKHPNNLQNRRLTPPNISDRQKMSVMVTETQLAFLDARAEETDADRSKVVRSILNDAITKDAKKKKGV